MHFARKWSVRILLRVEKQTVANNYIAVIKRFCMKFEYPNECAIEVEKKNKQTHTLIIALIIQLS